MPDQLFSVSKSLIQYKHKEQIKLFWMEEDRLLTARLFGSLS